MISSPTLGASLFSISLINVRPGTHTNIAIYDVAGKIVNNYVDVFEIRWSGQDDTGRQLPAGVYFVHVTYHNTRMIEKLIFIR